MQLNGENLWLESLINSVLLIFGDFNLLTCALAWSGAKPLTAIAD